MGKNNDDHVSPLIKLRQTIQCDIGFVHQYKNREVGGRQKKNLNTCAHVFVHDTVIVYMHVEREIA